MMKDKTLKIFGREFVVGIDTLDWDWGLIKTDYNDCGSFWQQDDINCDWVFYIGPLFVMWW